MRPLQRVLLLLVAATLLAGLGAAPANGSPSVAAPVPQESVPEPEETEDGGETIEDCGPLDVPCMMFDGAVGFGLRVVAGFLGSDLLSIGLALTAEPPPTQGAQETWRVSLVVANSLFVLLVTAGGVLVMGHTTLQSSIGVKELVPRLVVAFVATNASWFLMRELAELAAAVSHALLFEDGLGPDDLGPILARFIEAPLTEATSLIGLAAIAVLVALGFVFSVVMRVVLWIVLTAAAPLALASYALPQTQGLARLWWRAVVAVLLMQVAQALVLRLAMALFVHREGPAGLFELEQNFYAALDLLVLIVLLYVLMVIPKWATSAIFTPQSSGIVKGAKMLATFLVFRGTNKLLAAGKAGASAAGTARSGGAARGAGRTSAMSQRRGAGAATRRSSGSAGAMPRVQRPLAGMDAQIDRGAQARLREQRRYVQPQLPFGQANRPSRPTSSAAGARGGRGGAHQDLLPGMPPRQEPLFEAAPQMQHPPPRPEVPSAGGASAGARREATRRAAAHTHTRRHRREG